MTKTCKLCGLPITPKSYYKESNDRGFCSYQCADVYDAQKKAALREEERDLKRMCS